MTTEIAIVEQNGAIARSTQGSMTFSPEQRKLIRDTFANGASDSEFVALMAVAERRGLDPFLRQVYFVKRWDGQKKCEVWAVQASIDGLRSIAQRTGLYDGQDEPEFEHGENGSIKLAKVRVYRKDWTRPAVGVAHWSEYVQTKKDGGVNAFWSGKSHIMIAKCAEALALRKAFPEDTSGIYIPEEMGQIEREINPPPAKPVVVPDEPPHDAATGEVIEEDPRKLRFEQMKAELRAGFPNWDTKREWREANKAAKSAIPLEWQLELSHLYIAATPVSTKQREEPPPPEAA